jgi:hypothetical protein
MNKYPIYIPSKGRADSQKTVRLLEKHGIDNYYVVVEKSEYFAYCDNVEKEHVLRLPGDNYGTSSVARNFAIEHSRKKGFLKHWQIDDDVTRIIQHNKAKLVTEDIKFVLSEVEKISDAYPTVSITGMHMMNFLGGVTKPVTINTMVSGAALVTNTALRFRGTMYVDRDFVLQSFKRGYITVKCNDFAFAYVKTLVQKGGYYDTYSDDEKRLKSIKEFLSYHPEVDPTVERHPLGFLHLKNIGAVWSKYKIKKSK